MANVSVCNITKENFVSPKFIFKTNKTQTLKEKGATEKAAARLSIQIILR